MLGLPGLKVGHYTDPLAATGCTVVLCPEGAVASVYIPGGAPGTRETDLLRPASLVSQVHAIVLSGGSAFGLEAASGVMRYLEEKGCGFDMGTVRVPIVPAAIIFDLRLGDPMVRPGPEEGYRACLAATEGPVAEGSVGAGTGATVGKALGPPWATKGGLGCAPSSLGDGTRVAALAVVNAFGDVVDPDSGRRLAGPRLPPGGFADTLTLLQEGRTALPPPGTSTTLGVIATDATLSREQAHRLARMAGAGLAQAIRPAYTLLDGDAIFCLALGLRRGPADMMALGALASRLVAQAVVRGIGTATGLCGIPSAREWLEGAV
ncbi:MAG: P1 family peptidase [Chloroflexi bacterium]|nr:P1 family peptidase [Chloroflexota bacterium]